MLVNDFVVLSAFGDYYRSRISLLIGRNLEAEISIVFFKRNGSVGCGGCCCEKLHWIGLADHRAVGVSLLLSDRPRLVGLIPLYWRYGTSGTGRG